MPNYTNTNPPRIGSQERIDRENQMMSAWQPVFYREAIIRQGNGRRTTRKIFASDAVTIDAANRERCEIANRYHKNQIVEITTHRIGMDKTQ